jgi:cytochrome c-type protein NapB
MKMRIVVFLVMVLAVGAGWSRLAPADEKVKSLRGGEPIEGRSLPPLEASPQTGDQPISRTFVHQPPLIPHEIEEYAITLKKNDCLECHGQEDSDAPRPHKSHYRDLQGEEKERHNEEKEEISSLWYFCTQCHVIQDKAKPLVDNTFKP